MKPRAPWVLILGLQLALVLPFIGQPIHMDDSIFVDIGRNAIKVPWQPHDFPYIFEGEPVSDMASHSHPPFVGYWIGLLLWIFGDGPNLHVMLHLGFLIFPLLFAAAMYRLAIRFSNSPALATAIAITSPAAVVSSHTLMSDYPCLAFSTMALALYVEGVDTADSRRLWISGIFATLAAFCSYPALAISALCWLYAWLRRARTPAAIWSPVIAMAWMAAWLGYSSIYFDRFILGRTADYVLQSGGLTSAGLAGKLLAFPIFLAGTLLILPWPLIRSACRATFGVIAIAWTATSYVLIQGYASEYSTVEQWTAVILLTLGGWILIGLLLHIGYTLHSKSDGTMATDAIFLGAWVAAMIVPIVFAYTSGMARYLLPLLPPIVLLTFHKSTATGIAAPRWAAAFSLVMATTLAVLLSVADFQTARAYKSAAESLGKKLAAWKDHTRFGAEWGFRHYMLEQGFRPFLSTSSDLKGGDFIVTVSEAVPYNLPQDAAAMLNPVFGRMEEFPTGPIRLMSHDTHAGFYSSAWGILPFSIWEMHGKPSHAEAIVVQQISYLVEKLPEIVVENASPGDTIIPYPGRLGGADVLIPAPSRMRIPYDGPFPVIVEFLCKEVPSLPRPEIGVCPRIDVSFATSDSVVSIPWRSEGENGFRTFELASQSPGTIVLDVPTPTSGDNKIRLENWVMVPPELAYEEERSPYQ